MPTSVERPRLPKGSIELANLGVRPAFVRADSDGSSMPASAPLHVRRALNHPPPARTHTGWQPLPSPLSGLSSPGGWSAQGTHPLAPFESISTSGALPFRRPSVVHVPKFLGRPTAYRPAYLLALGSLGATVFGLGTTILQKALWPAKAYAGLDPDGDTLIPAGTPGAGVLTGGRNGDAALGGTMVALGVLASVAGSTLFFMDAQRLAKRQSPNSPNLTRPRAYYSAHLFGLACLVGSRFLAEAMRRHLPDNMSWLLTLPGALGTAIFAVTQAQSFSSCELYNGTVPLPNRARFSQAARAGVSAWIVLGAMAGTPNMSSYVREAIKLVAQTATTLAFSLSLTEARIMERDHPTAPVIGPLRFRGDLTAMQSFGLYSVARLISSVGAAIFANSEWPADTSPIGPNAALKNWRNLPPPLPSKAPIESLVPEAAAIMIFATGLGAYSFFQLRKDLLPRGTRYANFMFAAAVSCLLLGQAYRIITEHSKSHAAFKELWIAMPIGVTANAIAYVVLPEMVSQAEVTQGNRPVAYRYQAMEASRFFGTCLWAFWVGASSIQFIPPLVRQMMAAGASLITILAMALPDATTRSRQTGFYTPAVERPSFM